MQEQYAKIIIKELEIKTFIGIYDFEKKSRQRILINVDLWLENININAKENIKNTISYEDVKNQIEYLCEKEHINLVETLAQKIIDICFNYKLCKAAKVKVVKPDIFKNTKHVGIEIYKKKTAP